jgi:dephospho-CoA kinase
MHIIGLTGGIASGKSAVADELTRLGAVVLDADKAAHRVINYPEIKKLLTQRWGPAILTAAGDVNRRAVGARVFGPATESREDREYLESVLHPRIRAEFAGELERLEGQDVPAAVIDAPLLLEAGWTDLCDILIFVDSPREASKQRAMSLRNWTAEDFAAREAAQMPIEEKRRHATHIIVNDGTLDDLRVRVCELWQSLPTS